MNRPGDADLISARAALLNALEALAPHLGAVVVIGAQAIYLHTGDAPVALAETTRDGDLALDVRSLADAPLLEDTMKAAGFQPDPRAQQPGRWIAGEAPVDLLVPESLSGPGGRRGARIPPHSKRAARRAAGLEAAMVDRSQIRIAALDPDDARAFTVSVAGPAALLIAKLHKLGERREQPDRLLDKDAHDLYRLLVAIPTGTLAGSLDRLLSDALAGSATAAGIVFLEELFVPGPEATGSLMAGRAEEGVGDPSVVSAASAELAADLLTALRDATKRA